MEHLLPAIKKIVVLGHTGYFGERLFRYLQTRHADVPVVGFSSRQVDLRNTLEVATLKDHFDDQTAVVMCSGIKSNFGDNLDNCATNIKMAENICRLLSERPVKRFLFFSSIAVYGVHKQGTDITEQTPATPDTFYGISKYTSESLLDVVFSRRPSSSVVHVRTPTIYGPGERIQAATPSGFMQAALKNQDITIWGDGSELREFIYVDDLIRTIEELLFSSYSGILNTSDGAGRSYRETLDCISSLLGRQLTIHSRERTTSKVDKTYDTSLFRSLFPQFRFTRLEDGLRSIMMAQKVEVAA